MLNGRNIDKNVAEIRRLLFAAIRFPVSGKAGWCYFKPCCGMRGMRVAEPSTGSHRRTFERFGENESHPLVLDGIRLVRRALRQREMTADGRNQLGQ